MSSLSAAKLYGFVLFYFKDEKPKIDNSHIMNRHRTTSRGIEINPEDNIMQQHNGKKQRNDDGETDTASENDDDDHQRAPHDTDALNINQNGQRKRSL